MQDLLSKNFNNDILGKLSHKEVATMKQWIKLFTIIIITLHVVGCSSNQQDWSPIEETSTFAANIPSKEVSNSTPNRKIRTRGQISPGYLMALTSPEDSSLDGEYRVDFDGNLTLPYDISIRATGLTTSSLLKKLQKAYEPFFVSTPEFQAKIKEKKYWVDAQGLVAKPGRYLMDRDSTLDDLIVQAGGLQHSADKQAARYAELKDGSYSSLIKLSDYYSGLKDVHPSWHGGETVFFQSDADEELMVTTTRSDHVQVLGQVRRPGEFTHKSEADFFYYLIQAGGPTDRADLQNVVIVRENSGKKMSRKIDLENMKSLPTVSGGDIVMVHAQNPSSTEKKTQMFGTVGSVISDIATTVLVFFAL